MLKLSTKILLCLLPTFLSAQDRDDTVTYQHKIHQNIKVNMFPMAGGRLSFNYELQLNPRAFKHHSVQFNVDVLGAIPIQRNSYYQPAGYSAGLMFKSYLNGNGHPLDGTFLFLQGSSGFLNFYENYSYTDLATSLNFSVKKNYNQVFGLALAGIGHQYVLHDVFALEFSGAAGLYVGSRNDEMSTSWQMTAERSPLTFGFGKLSNIPFAYTASIKLGYAFASKQR